MPNDESPKVLSRKETVDSILSQVRDKFPGQKMSEKNVEKAQATIAESAAEGDQAEAAEFAERIVAWLNEEWNDREFTLEQRIFSIQLAVINLRQHLPEDKGGKAYFDEVGRLAWEFYRKATGG